MILAYFSKSLTNHEYSFLNSKIFLEVFFVGYTNILNGNYIWEGENNVIFYNKLSTCEWLAEI